MTIILPPEKRLSALFLDELASGYFDKDILWRLQR